MAIVDSHFVSRFGNNMVIIFLIVVIQKNDKGNHCRDNFGILIQSSTFYICQHFYSLIVPFGEN